MKTNETIKASLEDRVMECLNALTGNFATCTIERTPTSSNAFPVAMETILKAELGTGYNKENIRIMFYNDAGLLHYFGFRYMHLPKYEYLQIFTAIYIIYDYLGKNGYDGILYDLQNMTIEEVSSCVDAYYRATSPSFPIRLCTAINPDKKAVNPTQQELKCCTEAAQGAVEMLCQFYIYRQQTALIKSIQKQYEEGELDPARAYRLLSDYVLTGELNQYSQEFIQLKNSIARSIIRLFLAERGYDFNNIVT